MMNKARSSGQDNASREGVDDAGCDRSGACVYVEDLGWVCPYDCLSSTRTSAETPEADCPSSQSKDAE